MTTQDARHLLARTCFGPTQPELLALTKRSTRARVDLLLAGVRVQPLSAPPAWLAQPDPWGQRRATRERGDQAQIKALRQLLKQRAQEASLWWLQEMVLTPSPVTERLVLFWHGLFTSSVQKVHSPGLMLRQNALLRRHAAGHVGRLLLELCHDPAMILYLDTQTNRASKPNENFARELLELFTLGEGHYSEADVKEAARAFTGWQVDPQTGQARFEPRQHDKGLKTFLGHRGAWGSQDIVRILLKQERLAQHLVEQLWLEFIDPRPEPTEVKRLAAVLRGADYQLKPLLSALWTSPAFLDPGQRGAQIKSPLELVVGTMRLLKLPLSQPERLARALRALGHVPLMPPSVKGWPRDQAWITTDSLATRQQLLYGALRDEDEVPALAQGSLTPLLGPHKPQDAASLVVALMTPIPLVSAPPEGAAAFELVRHVALDLAYQLK